jgi:hypothetical protein
MGETVLVIGKRHAPPHRPYGRLLKPCWGLTKVIPPPHCPYGIIIQALFKQDNMFEIQQNGE